MKSHLEGILKTLKGYTAASTALLTESVSRKIVTFNRSRLQWYIRRLCTYIPECLETPKVSIELSDELRELLDPANKADNRELEEDECG